MLMGVLLAATVLALSAPAGAELVGFERITGNASVDVAGQLWVDVIDAGGNQVLFWFSNSGPIASSITDVYFDDGSLLGIASVVDGTGVDFEQGASPGNLPGGNDASPPFVASAGFTADSEPPTQPNGVNPSEWLKIFFDLQAGRTFADVLEDLESGELRIGLHVQAIGAEGESDSFVNTPPSRPIPEPATMLLLGGGLLGLAGLRRRRR